MNGGRKVLTSSLILLGSVLVLTAVLSSTAWAGKKDKKKDTRPVVTASEPSLKMVRRLETQDVLTAFDRVLGLDEGVAFPPTCNIVVKLDPAARADRGADSADVGLLSADGEMSATIEIPDPINTACDVEKKGNAFRTFIYDSKAREIIAMKDKQGYAAPDTIARFDMTAADLEDVQGMALDPQRNRLYLLNVRGEGSEIVEVKIGGGRSLPPAKLRNAKRWDLSNVVGKYGKPRCIAYKPQNSHLYVFNPGTNEMIELTNKGNFVASHDVDRVVDLDLTDLKGCIFAPSSDRTDNASLFNLFLANGGSPSGVVTEWSLN